PVSNALSLHDALPIFVKDHFTRYPVDVTQGTMHASQKRCHVQRRDELHVTNPRPRQREREAIEGEFRTVDRDPPHVSPIYLGLRSEEHTSELQSRENL